MGGAHLYPTFILQRKGQPWEWCSVGSLLRIAVKLVKLMFAFLGCWSLLDSIRGLKCCCCISTGLVHHGAEHCQDDFVFRSAFQRPRPSAAQVYIRCFCLTIMSIEFCLAHGFATVRSSGSTDSASTLLLLVQCCSCRQDDDQGHEGEGAAGCGHDVHNGWRNEGRGFRRGVPRGGEQR